MDENEVFTPVHVKKRIYSKTVMSVNKGKESLMTQEKKLYRGGRICASRDSKDISC